MASEPSAQVTSEMGSVSVEINSVLASQLAQEIRETPEWHSLGIDFQALSLLRLPTINKLIGPKPSKGINPVSYKSRKPGSKDCDKEGKCWRFHPAQPTSSNPFLSQDSWVLSSNAIGTHWLPHDAPYLPVKF